MPVRDDAKMRQDSTHLINVFDGCTRGRPSKHDEGLDRSDGGAISAPEEAHTEAHEYIQKVERKCMVRLDHSLCRLQVNRTNRIHNKNQQRYDWSGLLQQFRKFWWCPVEHTRNAGERGLLKQQ